MDHYETPKKIYEEICDIFKIYPQLDVCATKHNTKCKEFFERGGWTGSHFIGNAAFSRDWSSDFFMNCPYSNCKKWIKYAYLQHIKHNVNGLAILNVSTGSAYWHDYIIEKAEIYYYKRRIKFELNGIPQTNPRYDSAFICWRKRKEK